MPLATVAIPFDISDKVGTDFDARRTKAWVTTNAETIIDTDGNLIRVGSGIATVAADGTGTFNVWVPGTGSNPDSWQTTFHFSVPDRNAPGGRLLLDFGPFTITAAANLADLVTEMVMQPEYASDVLDRLDALEAESGSSSLIVVSGGAVDLDNTKADGYLVGYRVTATTTFEGASFEPGSYIFERDSTTSLGWSYRTLEAATPIVVVADVTAPTAPSLSVDNSSSTQLVATFSGGTDDTAVTQYRTRIDAGAWTVGASPRTFTGLTASTSYTIDAQAGDAANNWSTSTSWTGSTAGLSYNATVLSHSPQYYYRLNETAGATTVANAGSAGGTAAVTGSVTLGATGLGDGTTSADFAGGRIDLPSAANLNGVTSLTIGAIAHADIASDNAYIGNGGTGFADSWVLGGRYAGVEGQYGSGAANGGTVRHLYTLTWDGTTISRYHDGTLIGTATHSTAISTTGTWPRIGQQGNNTSPWDGKIAGFFIISGTALTQPQIAALATAAGI